MQSNAKSHIVNKVRTFGHWSCGPKKSTRSLYRGIYRRRVNVAISKVEAA